MVAHHDSHFTAQKDIASFVEEKPQLNLGAREPRLEMHFFKCEKILK
jgi:hypothetical protein